MAVGLAVNQHLQGKYMTKIALVTGASSGIGRNAAMSLSAKGFKVVITARSLDGLKETAKLCAGEVDCIASDVTDVASVDALFEQIRKLHGRLDVLFNNAGNSLPSINFGDMKLDQFKGVIDVNLTGAFLMANRAYRMMRDQAPQGGRIINNGSISAYMPRPGSAAYTASKHAISGLTRSIALDGRVHNIACGQIDIGNAASDMTTQISQGVPQADGSIKGEPTINVQHIGDAVVHMASLPLEANILFMNVMATTMPFVGRG
jgi:NAD(P)-dependent dehydrogenase (short-subunit alcohol dehydrogenase family)